MKKILEDVDEIIMMDLMLQENEQVLVAVDDGDDDFLKVWIVKRKDLDDWLHL
jgi:hypothetical protein